MSLKCKRLVQHAILKKEVKIMATMFKTFIPATERTGIPESIQTIVERHNAGATTTSIVAPPRYGKSDIIRLSAMELVENGDACAALALAPWNQLANQLVNTEKMQAMADRYMDRAKLSTVPRMFVGGRINHMSDTFHETSKIQHLFTATIQMVNLQIGKFEDWLIRCMSYGERPIVFIDEGQLLSTKNKWGEIAKLTIKHGAHIVLLTGTPYRSDCKAIPGFRVEVMNQEHVEHIITRRIDDKHLLKKTFEGIKAESVLKADHTISLHEAWDIKALCKIDTKWIDVDMLINGKDKQLSELKTNSVCQNLRNVVTDQKTIRNSMEKAIDDMKYRRNAGMKDAGIIVVTACDITDEMEEFEVNQHAKRVRKEIEYIDPTLNVIIATQAEDDENGGSKGSDMLDEFAKKGRGDILIVKNMGTVGLDCPRIKTVVLLGTTRQLASWVQTILRGGTTVENVPYFTLILTDDVRNRENWEFIVKGQGGEMTHLSDLKQIDEEVIEKEKDPTQDKFINILDAKYVRTEDSHDDLVLTDESDIQAVLSAYPEFGRFSAVEIAKLIQSGAVVVPKEKKSTAGVFDAGEECRKLRKQMNDIADKLASKKATYDKNNPRCEWKEWRKKAITYMKNGANIRQEIGKETDPEKLRIALSYGEKALERINGR